MQEIQPAPAAVSWGNNRIDVFIKGPLDALWHKWWNGQWSHWENLGGSLTSAPTVSTWSENRLDIFALGSAYTLVHKWWNGRWSEWEDLGKPS